MRRSDRLDEYVRQATMLDGQRTAAPGDPVVKQELFEEIVSMHTADPPVPPSLPARRRLYAVAIAAGAAAIAAALTVTVALDSHSRTPTATPNPTQPTRQIPPATHQGDVFGSGTAFDCVERYSPQTLAKRGFAFDGTVLSVQGRSAGGAADPYVPVVFQVNRWFRGGHGDRVTVAMFPPGLVTSVGNAAYGVGSRLLVSGEARYGGDPLNQPMSWACGFTRWYTETDAGTWEQTFG
jgi:hypothetical protein